jgi:polysaccharide deacetylase family protein (PEP-CTERM system associated)
MTRTRPDPDVLNAFTVDLEDWFQGLTSTNARVDLWPELESRVVTATGRLLEVLRDHQVTATFFVLGYVADRHPKLIETVALAGHELAVHGYHHRFVSRLTPDQFAEELEKSIEAVARVAGQPPLGHRAPYFSINDHTGWAFEVIERCGLRYDSSVFPVRSLLHGFPDAPRFPYRVPGRALVEFPVSTLRLAGTNWPIGGGFYVRALPGEVVRQAIRRLNRAGRPAVIYVHPWELDTRQRYEEVTVRERVSHYLGRRGLEHKLHRLLTEFRFGSLQMLLDHAWAEPSR